VKALIAPTRYGTFGIWWLEGTGPRGGQPYSGPYTTRDEAEQAARDWAAAYGVELELEHRDQEPSEEESR